MKNIGLKLLTNWRLFVIFLFPVLLLPLALQDKKEVRCGFVVLVMAVFWVTEVVPLPITAFIPLFLFPMLGIMSAKDVAPNYLKDSNFVFVGSLMMAVAVEESNLHKRLAVNVLLLMGSNPRFLMLGFQLVTGFLSMWMSNTATTAMMLPIALAIIKQLHSFRTNTEEGGEINFDLIPLKERKIYKAILLSICYSANIGGFGTLTGTGTNIVLSGQLDSLYHSQDDITFASWMTFAAPQMIVNLFISWLVLQIIFFGIRQPNYDRMAATTIVRKKYEELQSMSFHEFATLLLFILLVLLWLLREPKIFPGYGHLFPKGYFTDGSASMLIGCLLFVFPRQMSTSDENNAVKATLLTWSEMQIKFPWGIVMLVGGGYAMADGVKISGLSDSLASGLGSLTILPSWLFVLISITLVTFVTEFSSNVATATIFIPLIASVADASHINPLYYIIPVTISCSFAFMLPVATPPNAIVFSAKVLKVKDMMLSGLVMNLISVFITMINIHTYGWWLFNFETFPLWAQHRNSTIN